MNEKELLTRDLCGRLTHGIFVETQESISNDYGEIEETYDITDIMCIFHLDNFMNHGVKLKPIYRPMSDLTKLITQANYNDGKQFVPKEVIDTIAECDISYIGEYGGTFAYGIYGKTIGFKALPIWVCDLLTQWHFNWRNLPAHLWVDVNSLENDCYA